MNERMRRILQVTGGLLVVAFIAMLWLGRKKEIPVTLVVGEEVYASHDCTDCHLSAPVLAEKKKKREPGLIRMRKDFTVLLQFLETDKRHASFTMISADDRRALVDYLRTLLPPE